MRCGCSAVYLADSLSSKRARMFGMGSLLIQILVAQLPLLRHRSRGALVIVAKCVYCFRAFHVAVRASTEKFAVFGRLMRWLPLWTSPQYAGALCSVFDLRPRSSSCYYRYDVYCGRAGSSGLTVTTDNCACYEFYSEMSAPGAENRAAKT
jgi:hypothetical protein